MYAYFKGILEQKFTDSVIIEVGGIGYNIQMPAGKILIMPPEGSEVRIYTYTSVREDALELYGFTRQEELSLFKKLITVSGVGPKSALAMISAIPVADIKTAILTGDYKILSQTPGVGKKTAERMIIDLKDKMDTEVFVEADDSGVLPKAVKLSLEQSQALDALCALGFGQKESKEAVIKASEGSSEAVSSDDLFKAALRFM